MSEKKVSARARVQITLEIDVGSVWGDDCQISQIHKQARDSVLDDLRTGLIINGSKSSLSQATKQARIIGQPIVMAILVDEAQ